MDAVTSKTATLTFPTDEEILITREFDAPKHLVYKAYTTPELVKRWWSARRGAVHTADIDLRVGGTWRYVMTTEDGQEVGFHGEYREIVPDERIVCTEVYEGAPDTGEEPVLNLVTFTELEGRTTLDILMRCPSKAVRDMIIESGMEDGLQDALALLEGVAISLR